MRKFTFYFIVIILATSLIVKAKEVECETVTNFNWPYFIGQQKTCDMRRSTAIESNNDTISTHDENVLGFLLRQNKKISHLPINIHENFPDLVSIDAHACAIKSISRENFRNLSLLKVLWLQFNKIEMVHNDVFRDLSSLERLFLNGNQIKSLNGQVFNGLKMLKQVLLAGNSCIKENFAFPTRIAAIPQSVSQKCGFNEPLTTTVEPSTTTIGTSTPTSETQQIIIRELKASAVKAILDNEICQAEAADHFAKIASFEAELIELRSIAFQAQKRIAALEDQIDLSGAMSENYSTEVLPEITATKSPIHQVSNLLIRIADLQVQIKSVSSGKLLDDGHNMPNNIVMLQNYSTRDAPQDDVEENVVNIRD